MVERNPALSVLLAVALAGGGGCGSPRSDVAVAPARPHVAAAAAGDRAALAPDAPSGRPSGTRVGERQRFSLRPLGEDAKGTVFTTDGEYELCADCRAQLEHAGHALMPLPVAPPWPKPP